MNHYPKTLIAMGLACLIWQPAMAAHEGHQHGQEAAVEQSASQATAPEAMDDMKSGGKSCKKCKKGMSGGQDPGDAETAALESKVRQLEKRLDLVQTMLEMMADRRCSAGSPASHH